MRPSGHTLRRPYKLITTDDPSLTFGEGRKRHYASMIEAANAFVHAQEPCKAIVYDDGCLVRDLDEDEEWLLEQVCHKLGYDLEDV
jgi:hypothetical protein